MKSSSSTAFKKLSPYTPRVVSINYVAFPVDNAVQVFGNEPQTYTANCDLPGFPSVTVTIPANTYQSFISQADANEKALEAATEQAISQLVCCYSDDPLPDTPNFGSLSNDYSVSGSAQYGLLPFEEVAEEVVPYVSELHNWTMCPTCDFCNGPDDEGITQPDLYTQRWFVRESGGSFVYGKESITENPVPSDLFTGIDQEDITHMSLSFDANARPCFAFQIASGTILLRRYIAGTPTFTSFAGDTPRLWFDGVLQPDGSITDICCFYVRAGEIKVRMQRDAFGVEYTWLAPIPAVSKITKTDAVSSYQYLYFQDVNDDYWLAKSEVYPIGPSEYSDALRSTVAPRGGAYDSVVTSGGSYSDTLFSTVAPSASDYELVTVLGGTYTDDLTASVAPSGGEYALVIVGGGSYSDTMTSTVSPGGGDYVLESTPGGTYSDSLNSTVSPSGGSYV